MSASAHAASWPMFRRDVKRTGYAAEQAYPPLLLRWRHQAGGAVLSSPAVAYGKVYVGSRSRSLDAIDAFTGELAWTYRAGGWIDSSPAVADGVVYFASRDGKVHALDASTGQVKWIYSTGSTDLASPAVLNGEVVVVTGYPNKQVVVLDAATGALRRGGVLPSFATSSPTLDPDRGVLIAATNDGQFTAYDFNNLSSTLWSTATVGAAYFSTLASAPSFVVGLAGNDDRKARAFAQDTGVAGWTSAPNLCSGPMYVGSPAVAADRVVLPRACESGTPACPSCKALRTTFYSVTLSTGGVLWSSATVGVAPQFGFLSSPAIASDIVYVGGGDEGGGSAYLYAVGLSTGGVVAKYNLGSEVLSSPAVANGWVYVGTLNGQLFAFQTSYVTAIASPDPALTSQLTGVVPIQGYVLSPDTVTYTVEFGESVSPSSWTTLATSTTQANGGVLADWDTSTLLPGYYTVRVSAVNDPVQSFVSVATATFAVTQAVSQAIGTQGGVMALADGTELVIPAGALSATSTITITRLLTGFPNTGVPSNTRTTNIVREVTVAGNPNPTFPVPLILKVPYAPADLPAGAAEKNLRIYYYDTSKGEWRIVNTSSPKPGEGRVWATLTHLTTFRVMEYSPLGADLVTAFYSYPNPATGDTVTFKFQLDADSDVKISVYNVAGDIVAELSQPNNPGGIASTLTWNVKRKASGVYIAILEATSGARSAKVTKHLAIKH